MRVYVASGYGNKQAVRDAMDMLVADGHTITHDWTDIDDPATAKEWRWCARADLGGVYTAEALVLLVVPDMRGAWVEMGAALAKNIPVVVVGGNFDCIFERLSFAAASMKAAIDILGVFRSYP